MDYPIIDLKSSQFEDELITSYQEYGVCVIKNVIDTNVCNNLMDDIVSSFEKLGTGIDRHKSETWNINDLPIMTRTGMFQASMCNLPSIWKIKVDPNIVKIFEILYSKLKNTSYLIVSNDGINIKHPGQTPYHNEKTKFKDDWAHIDQTITSDPFHCIQGQLVMTNTTAAFRCTPKSHLYLDDLLTKYNKQGDTSNWFKFNETTKKEIKEYLEEKGCKWQIPIYAPQGSFIVWSSGTIHSAKHADGPVQPKIEDPWYGWRGVLYICYRPRTDHTSAEIVKKVDNIRQNRVMNHWGEKTFALMPGGGYQHKIKRHKKITEIINDPTKVYDILGIDIEKEVLNDENIMYYLT